MDIIIYQVDAFTDKPFGGNPAGVVTDAKSLTDESMQKIAMEMNLSETAFVIPKGDNNYQVRFFTPRCEVDLCGHATIATFYTLAHKGYINNIDNGIVTVYQETRIGRLPVEIYYVDGSVEKVMMYQGEPKSLGYINDLNELYNTLGISSFDIDSNLIPEIISTGLPDIIIPVKDRVTLDNLKVDFSKLEELSNRLNVVGAHVFCNDFSTGKDIIYCRNFAPAVGINEEAATGTANGALMYYLKKNKAIKGNLLTCYQGDGMKRPSKIICQSNEYASRIDILVGGKATIVIEGVISI